MGTSLDLGSISHSKDKSIQTPFRKHPFTRTQASVSSFVATRAATNKQQNTAREHAWVEPRNSWAPTPQIDGGGDDTVGNPHRAQISRFELFELILLLKADQRFSIERFEATVCQSAVPFPPSYHPLDHFAAQCVYILRCVCVYIYIYV